MQTHMATKHEPPDGNLPTGRFCVDGGGKEVGLNLIFGSFEPPGSSLTRKMAQKLTCRIDVTYN